MTNSLVCDGYLGTTLSRLCWSKGEVDESASGCIPVARRIPANRLRSAIKMCWARELRSYLTESTRRSVLNSKSWECGRQRTCCIFSTADLLPPRQIRKCIPGMKCKLLALTFWSRIIRCWNTCYYDQLNQIS